MQQHRFVDEETMRREHMTDDEARAVVELWAEKERDRERLASMPSVADMAEGLQVPVEEASALLAQVRQRRAQQEQRIRVRQTTNVVRWVSLVLAGLVAIGIVFLLSFLLSLTTFRGPVVTATDEPATVSVGAQQPQGAGPSSNQTQPSNGR